MLYRERPCNSANPEYGVSDICLLNPHIEKPGYRMMFQNIRKNQFPSIQASFNLLLQKKLNISSSSDLSSQKKLNIPYQRFIICPFFDMSFLPLSYIKEYRFENYVENIMQREIIIFGKAIRTRNIIYGRLTVLAESDVTPNPNDGIWREFPFHVVDDNVTQLPIIGRDVLEYLVLVFWRNKICYGSIEPLKTKDV